MKFVSGQSGTGMIVVIIVAGIAIAAAGYESYRAYRLNHPSANGQTYTRSQPVIENHKTQDIKAIRKLLAANCQAHVGFDGGAGEVTVKSGFAFAGYSCAPRGIRTSLSSTAYLKKVNSTWVLIEFAANKLPKSDVKQYGFPSAWAAK